ncbi:MAG: hypothetical protein ACRD3O_06975 [Terriglobia bacterium]
MIIAGTDGFIDYYEDRAGEANLVRAGLERDQLAFTAVDCFERLKIFAGWQQVAI